MGKDISFLQDIIAQQPSTIAITDLRKSLIYGTNSCRNSRKPFERKKREMRVMSPMEEVLNSFPLLDLPEDLISTPDASL